MLLFTSKYWLCLVLLERYMCGLDYFENGRRLFAKEDDVINNNNRTMTSSAMSSLDVMVVHNNWIVSREAKVYRFKEHLMWQVDNDRYYRSLLLHISIDLFLLVKTV